MKDVSPGFLGWKVGNRTKITAGAYNQYKVTTGLSGMDKYMKYQSDEHVFIGAPARTETPFSNPGDSGSVVYDKDGKVVGLLFRGQIPNQASAGYTFVTPISDVFDDIKLMTGVEDVRVAQD